jgi:hypothetical protein
VVLQRHRPSIGEKTDPKKKDGVFQETAVPKLDIALKKKEFSVVGLESQSALFSSKISLKKGSVGVVVVRGPALSKPNTSTASSPEKVPLEGRSATEDTAMGNDGPDRTDLEMSKIDLQRQDHYQDATNAISIAGSNRMVGSTTPTTTSLLTSGDSSSGSKPDSDTFKQELSSGDVLVDDDEEEGAAAAVIQSSLHRNDSGDDEARSRDTMNYSAGGIMSTIKEQSVIATARLVEDEDDDANRNIDLDRIQQEAQDEARREILEQTVVGKAHRIRDSETCPKILLVIIGMALIIVLVVVVGVIVTTRNDSMEGTENDDTTASFVLPPLNVSRGFVCGRHHQRHYRRLYVYPGSSPLSESSKHRRGGAVPHRGDRLSDGVVWLSPQRR